MNAWIIATASTGRHPLSAQAAAWGVVIGVLLLVLRWFARLLKGGKLCTPTGTPGSSSSSGASWAPGF
jgi:hypothetical protein